MISKKIIINLEKKDDIFHLEPLGDIHCGHAGFNEELYRARVKAIADADDRYTIFMGDQIDAITVYDKRFNPDTSVEHSIDNQRKQWQELKLFKRKIQTNHTRGRTFRIVCSMGLFMV